MKTYFVHVYSPEDGWFSMTFQADDVLHAVEQFQDAEPLLLKQALKLEVEVSR